VDFGCERLFDCLGPSSRAAATGVTQLLGFALPFRLLAFEVVPVFKGSTNTDSGVLNEGSKLR
jgi:hypothetical protein